MRKAAPRKAARKAAPRKAAARKTPVRKPAARKRSVAPRPRKSAPPPQFEQGTPREHEDSETLIPGAREDDLAEELGEESVEAATSGQSPAEDNLNEEVPEETGGPFVETSADEETGHHTDGSRRDK